VRWVGGDLLVGGGRQISICRRSSPFALLGGRPSSCWGLIRSRSRAGRPGYRPARAGGRGGVDHV